MMEELLEEVLFGNEIMTVPVAPVKEWTEEKGLTNLFGENNCFINVVIQSLWHLEPFRLKFTQEKEHHRHQSPCVYCALEVIFTQYEFSDESRLPPTALREAMAIIFRPQMRFQLRELDDACEAFDAVLHCLHAQLSDEKTDAVSCTDVNCVAHKVFGMNVIEQVRCNKCGASSDPIQSNVFTLYTWAAVLRTAYYNEPGLSFCEYLHKAAQDEVRSCPNKDKCSNMCTLSHFVTSLPEVFAISVAWDTNDPLLSDIQTTVKMISMSINISNVFTFQTKEQKPYYYRLRGMICYYGKHYIAFFYNFIRRQWFYFDDTTVRMVGTEWSEIQDRCVRGRLQPSVLFYEAEQPVNTSLVFEKLVQDLSPIKISTTIPKDIEPSDLSLAMSKLPVPTGEASGQSFVMVPPVQTIPEPANVDFLVIRTNWLYRRQPRIFRFTDECFKRLLPTGGVEKTSFDYKDVLDVTRMDEKNFIINFYSGKESQYIESDRSLEMIEVLIRKAKAKGHTFPVKGPLKR